VGVLFFNPVRKYLSEFDMREPWSKTYIYHPYHRDEGTDE
jgi:hypothetical protein